MISAPDTYDMIGRELSPEEHEAKARAVANEARRLAREYVRREAAPLPKVPSVELDTKRVNYACVYWRRPRNAVPCLRCMACESESAPRSFAEMRLKEVG